MKYTRGERIRSNKFTRYTYVYRPLRGPLTRDFGLATYNLADLAETGVNIYNPWN